MVELKTEEEVLGRQVLDDGVDHFEAAAAKRLEQAAYIGDDAGGRERVELGLGLGLRRTEGAVLHIDDEKRCAALDDRPVAGEGVSWHDLLFRHLGVGSKSWRGPVLGFGRDQDRQSSKRLTCSAPA